jgi:two-component system, cell cycle sensor histidine kinase and response regulator CckA
MAKGERYIAFPKGSVARKIAIAYLLWSLAWVILSDEVLHLFLSRVEGIWTYETIKGVVYVLVSAALVWAAIRACELDYHKRQLAEEARFHSLSESGLIGIFGWNADGKVVDANDTFLELSGYSRKDLLSGRIWLDRVTPREFSAPRSFDPVASSARIFEHEVIRKDGSRVPVLGGRTVLAEAGGRGIGYMLDLSDLKQAELEKADLQARLMQSEKLNALGQLAGGVAQDFNTLLGVIVGYASLVDAKLDPTDPVRANIQEVLSAATRAKNLTTRLLTFSQKQLLHFETVDLNEVIRRSQGTLQEIAGDQVAVRISVPEEPSLISADPFQIEQVMANLVANARDAITEGGDIGIETKTIQIRGKSREFEEAKPGEYVALRVTDTGKGIERKMQSRIFEPFFTTKPHAYGMGLASCYGAVKQIGGHIAVQSEPGRGTAFVLLFPSLSKQEAQHAPTERGSGVSTPAVQKRILLIEDHNDLRKMLQFILSNEGFEVLSAANGEEACEVARAFPGEIDLVLSDVIMPRLGGPEAVSRILQSKPGAKVIYLTGFAEPDLLKQYGISDSILLEKPVLPEKLIAKVKATLLAGEEGPRSFAA